MVGVESLEGAVGKMRGLKMFCSQIGKIKLSRLGGIN